MFVAKARVAHLRVVVWTPHTLIADFTIGSNAGGHISLTIIMESLSEILCCSTHIPEMNEENLLLSSEMTKS